MKKSTDYEETRNTILILTVYSECRKNKYVKIPREVKIFEKKMLKTA